MKTSSLNENADRSDNASNQNLVKVATARAYHQTDNELNKRV